MNVLIVGGGQRSGASCMRADQLGREIGAMVHVDPYHDPPKKDVDRAEFIIIVKRLKKRWKKWVAHILHREIPIVWDCVDFWQQPEENNVGRDALIKQFHKQKGLLGARAVIVATKQMQRDCGGHYLPHHHRVGLLPGPVRRSVSAVAYEGDTRYLGSWQEALERACARRAWRFLINPPSLTEADIIVALRGEGWDGWPCRQWKSNVKYANALAAGRPIVTQPAAAFAETGSPGTTIETPEDLDAALDYWTPYDRRLDAAAAAERLEPDYRLDAIAARYVAILTRADVRNAILGIKK